MKLRIREVTKQSHSYMANQVCWVNYNEYITLGDDNALLKFDISNDSASQLAILDGEATTFDCSLMTKTQGELLAVGHVNGEMKILNKFGKVEKVIQAHKGAVTCIKWSHDGQTIASAGEEGTVKVGPGNTDLV